MPLNFQDKHKKNICQEKKFKINSHFFPKFTCLSISSVL